MIEGEFTDMGTLSGYGFILVALLTIPVYPGIRRILLGCCQDGAF